MPNSDDENSPGPSGSSVEDTSANDRGDIRPGDIHKESLTKADLAEKLYEELGFNKREAKELVELFFEEIRNSLESNEQVKLSGFGNFDLRDKKERPGRNPKTGEEIPITARRVVTFRPGQKLKSRVENYKAEPHAGTEPQ